MMKKAKTTVALSALIALSACGIFKGGKKTTPVLGERVPILVTENSIKPDETIANVPVTVPAPTANANWTQPGGDAPKAMGNLALGDTLSQAWTAQIPGGSDRAHLAAAPVVADGHLYVMDTEGAVHAFAADNGSQVWVHKTSNNTENARSLFGGGVSFENGKLYATNGLGDVVAMNAADGSEIWRQKPGSGGPLRGSPTLANGNVYVLSQDNQLFALSQADGHVVWTQSGSLESQGVFGVAAPAAARGTVVAGFSSGELNAYRYENGNQLWGDSLSRSSISISVSSLADIDADPVIDNDQVYAVGQGGRMVALDILSGRRLWEQNLAGISTPWVVGDWIYVVTDDGKLLNMARSTGKVRWISQLQNYRNMKKKKDPISWVGPVMAGNRLILANSEGQITSVSPTDGAVGATMTTKGSFSLSPVVANNMLYMLTDGGRIIAYR
ncbi:PQQ-binding-like beta-propeller repeat protein [Stakelama marina]|uniref:PQQ-binding-like beta-propeller repeat protein n=1 Tax=Stakelama marina TaxID=2826939 RepID=A0A8T4IBZ6_9SPHN|nr:PQQ-binding-like beta-propeller repeat protein [Stakelama marina]MBR0552177.1 PQQ-binding-like beta-propeller repeat protein [Stakelama marina]